MHRARPAAATIICGRLVHIHDSYKTLRMIVLQVHSLLPVTTIIVIVINNNIFIFVGVVRGDVRHCVAR